MSADAAVELLASLVIEDGRRWGEAAVEVQWEDARALLDPDGPTPYHFNTRARGYSKTADAAGCVVAAMICQMPSGSRCYWLASDKDQGRLAIDSIIGYVARTPELRAALEVDAFKVTVRATGTTIEVLAADAPSAFGLRPSFLVVDELAAWADTPGPQRLFDATTSALAKVPGARCLVITSAGAPEHFSYKLLEHARRDPLWRTNEVEGAPPWTPSDRLDEQRRRLLPSMFARLFENRWVASEDRLTSRADVLACVGPGSGSLDPEAGVQYRIGLDVGVRNDRCAAAVCSLIDHEDGTRVCVDLLEVWKPSKEHELDFASLEQWLVETSRTYNGARVVYDPYQAMMLAQGLRKARVPASEVTFTQTTISRLATTLFRLLHEHRLDLPDSQELIDELSTVRLRESGPGLVRLDHDSGRHDDMAVSIALAAHSLLDVPPQRMLRFRGAS